MLLPAAPDPAVPVLYCVQCGYDLRGTASAGVCPECGTPVVHSVDALARGYGGHSAAQSRGAGCLVLLWPVVLGVVVASRYVREPSWRSNTEYLVRHVAFLALTLVPVLLTLLGTWWLTRRPPAHVRRAPALRLVTRWSLLALLPLGWVALFGRELEVVSATAMQMAVLPPAFVDGVFALLDRYETLLTTAAWLAPAGLACVFWYSSCLPFTRPRSRFVGRVLALTVAGVTAYAAWQEFVVSRRGGNQPRILDLADPATILLLLGGCASVAGLIVGGAYWLNLWLRARRLARGR